MWCGRVEETKEDEAEDWAEVATRGNLSQVERKKWGDDAAVAAAAKLLLWVVLETFVILFLYSFLLSIPTSFIV